MEYKEKNPWKGLDTYLEGEILYGRDEDIRKLSQCVLGYDDTVLYGRSGIGKSSLLNAGILPASRIADFTPIYIRLNHRQEETYYEQILHSIEAENIRVVSISPVKDAERPMLWELFHRNRFETANGERAKIIIIFDQFEEIFTLQQNSEERRQFFYQIGSVLNKVKPDELEENNVKVVEVSSKPANVLKTGLVMNIRKSAANAGSQCFVNDNTIHIVFSLREDFLSDFEYYTSAIPSLKQHRYGLRPINEEQAAEIILRPRKGLVSKEVAKLIIEKVTQRTDFELDGVPEIEVDSAVLSLYMNRLFESHEGNQITAELVEEKGGAIIKDFYTKSISDIDVSAVEYLENTLVNDDDRRENKSFSTVARAIGQECVDKLIERSVLRKFVLGGDYKVEFIHDILCPVVKERKKQRQLLKQQQEERKRQEEENRRFLEEEQRKRKLLLEKANREKKKNRRRNIFLSSVIAILLVIGVVCYFWKFYVYSDNYALYELRNGKIVGVETSKLSSEECERTPLYYCLKHVGWFTHVSEIEVKTSNKQLPMSPRLKVLEIGESEVTDEKGTAFGLLLSAVCKIRISEDENQRIIKEEYVDSHGQVLFELNYSYINGNDAWAHFVSGDGQPLVVRDKGVEQARLSWNDDGALVGVSYYDHRGVCQEIAKGICGYLWNFQKDDVVCKYTLDEYSHPTNSSLEEYNAVYTKTSKDSVVSWYARCMSVNAHDADGMSSPANGPLGYAKMVRTADKTILYSKDESAPIAELLVKRDRNGNVLEERIEGKTSSAYPSLYRYSYDRNGFLTSKVLFASSGKPFGKNPDDIYKWTWKYNDQGGLIDEERIMASGIIAYSKNIIRKKNTLIEEIKDVSKPIYYVKRVETGNDKRKTIAYYGMNNQKLNGKWSVKSASTDSLLVYHKMIRLKQKNMITETYYSYNEKSNKVEPLQVGKDGTSYFKKVTTKDKNGIDTQYRTYDAQGNIIKSMMYFVQNGKVIGRAVCGVDGNPVRCNRWEAENFYYYKIFINGDNEGGYANIMAVNEWGEKSVLAYFDDKGFLRYCYTEYLNCTGMLFVDKNKTEYHISGEYSQVNFVEAKNLSKFSVPYLHILDKKSMLYQVGLRDGDRIIACGSWKFGMNSELLWNNWKLIMGHSIKMIVLRAAGNGYEQLEEVVSLPKNSNLYAEYHELALTNAEYGLLKTKMKL